ncbi:serine hydrolase domain-containing protein [Lactiplantibacillus paraplantarum]|uniref:serine hydrolase domain-containing protein n=1 Tax=Lactiplantibacillus paraplantarum TaxID=60520 RepID=UPI0005135EFF|nr:serine hydrolase domain-containing protein [Lactiplantibacillus paraplantarum]ALO04711.1 serine hydrolase [Lactiplantibacillus paraplantarum]KGE74118.1 beta-lactamase [Lactiplantibacillus paraplantarum]OAX75167.1 serine hydrolase [Lactiplantibacillus plantarum]RDG13548.1 serine hydrolase [Lactiplantibacillus paraplantarum]
MGTFKRTEAQINEMVQKQVIPGASYALIDGPEIHTGQMGVAQVKPTIKPLWADAMYDLASVTKVVGTTTVALQLIQNGLLEIDRPVHDYLPSLQSTTITSRNLMTHTSGLSGYILNRNTLSAEALLAALQQLPISNRNRNHRVVYTDLGLIIMGQVIERIVGEAIQPLITERVLRPLGLWHTSFQPSREKVVPTTYSVQTGLLQGIVHDPKAQVLGEHCGSAGLFASVTDLVRFSQLMLGQIDVPTVLTQATIANLYQDWTPNRHLRRSFGWNLWHRQAETAPVIFHTGYTGTLLMLDRQRQQGFVFLSNRVHPVANNQTFLPARRQLIAAWLADTVTN